MAAARRRIRVPLSQLTPELRDALRVIGVDVAEGESTHEEIAALVTEIQAERGVVEEEEVNPHPMTATEEDLLILRHRRQAEQALRFGQLYGRTARDLGMSAMTEEESIQLRQQFAATWPAVAEHLAAPAPGTGFRGGALAELQRGQLQPLQRSDLQQLREQMDRWPLRVGTPVMMSNEDFQDVVAWSASETRAVTMVRPYQLGLACVLNATVTIDEVINSRDDRARLPLRTYYIDWELRRKRVEVVRSRGWTKRNSRRLWAETLERGDDPEEFLTHAVEGTRPEDGHYEEDLFNGDGME